MIVLGLILSLRDGNYKFCYLILVEAVMKIVLQRVTKASVRVGEAELGRIGCGYVILLGVGAMDDEAVADKMIDKIKKLRLFADDAGKTNRSIGDINGEILVVSQFTLYADCRKGNRPSFTDAAPPERAEALYEYFLSAARPHFARVECGSFGAAMQVELVNDGPFTVVLEM